jgi:hypothetical protein
MSERRIDVDGRSLRFRGGAQITRCLGEGRLRHYPRRKISPCSGVRSSPSEWCTVKVLLRASDGHVAHVDSTTSRLLAIFCSPSEASFLHSRVRRSSG